MKLSIKQFLLLILTITLASTVCKANDKPVKEINMLSLFKKTDPIEKFWTWFKENEKKLRKFEEDPDKYLNEVLIQAKKIQAGLAIEFEPPKNGIINVTVSADGNRELFGIVQTIADKAPKIDGWKFIAFRQRMNLEQVKEMKLKAENHELDPNKIKFFPIINGDTLDIIIYIKGVSEENYNQVAYGGLLLLDNILGEYDCVTKVRSYDFHEMPTTKKELDDLLPLLDIASYIDNFHKSKKQ
jgi:hypothetical protein